MNKRVAGTVMGLLLIILGLLYPIYRIYNTRYHSSQKKEIEYIVNVESNSQDDNNIEIRSHKESNKEMLDKVANILNTKDLIAILKFPDIDLTEPILYNEIRDYYFRKSPNGKYNISGSVYLDNRNTPDFTDWNIIAYGHNMSTGEAFNPLEKLINSENNIGGNFYVYTNQGTMVYKVEIVREIQPEADLFPIEYDKNFAKNVSPEKRYMTLVTCDTKGSKRIQVIGKLIETHQD